MGEKLNLIYNWDMIFYKGLQVSPKFIRLERISGTPEKKSRWSSQMGTAEQVVPGEGLNRFDHPLI